MSDFCRALKDRKQCLQILKELQQYFCKYGNPTPTTLSPAIYNVHTCMHTHRKKKTQWLSHQDIHVCWVQECNKTSIPHATLNLPKVVSPTTIFFLEHGLHGWQMISLFSPKWLQINILYLMSHLNAETHIEHSTAAELNIKWVHAVLAMTTKN
jgi:hypothetical protein